MLLFWILSALLGALIILGLSVVFLGNWRMTLNRVISSYIALKQLEPHLSDKELFLAVLDSRYALPFKKTGGLKRKLYLAKEECKEAITEEIEGGLSVFNKYNLPILIFCCLLIEENSILRSKRYSCQEDLLNEITTEVKSQGFEKYI